ncbi:uracil-DNA glycosylase [Halobacteriales archaeon SW_7_68_16]|nr:MAG: uracil-DNA glycosylase [Halobacteriales archaeon SW_7_68_16]
MDEDCRNCSELCATRKRVVHGYGDAGAEFVFVGDRPSERADATGRPFAGTGLWSILEAIGFCPDAGAEEPILAGAYLTHLTRCRADRAPTDEEISNCDAFLTADLRTINPEIIVPVGERTLRTLAVEYTTRPADAFSLPADHAESIRGRGFELLPTVEPTAASDEQLAAFEAALDATLDRDFRQTKGRRGR